MTKYVAFLRGINVGGRVVRMADLKTCFEQMGFQNVTTLLQTGNVLFESDAVPAILKQDIEAGLTETFRYPARIQACSISKLADIIDAYPFGVASSEQHDYVIFLENDLETALLGEEYTLAPGEQVQVGDGVVYWRVAKGSTLKSSFAKLLTTTKYKDFNTNRNLRTLKKLVA